jgi:hypothetical protein
VDSNINVMRCAVPAFMRVDPAIGAQRTPLISVLAR